MRSPKTTLARDVFLFGVGILATFLVPVAVCEAQIEGASYTLQPSYNVIRWNNNIGIEDTELFGGRLGLNLGQYVSLQGYYLGRNDVDTRLRRLDDLPAPGGIALADQKVNLSLYGADMIFNFKTNENVVPFIKFGGGILRFDPRVGDSSEHIALKGGGGIRFGIARLQAELFAEDLAFRLNRYDLAPLANDLVFQDPDHNKLRHNLSVGAGLNFNLGGYQGAQTETDRAIADRFRNGLSGISVPIEPFIGRLNFNDQTGLDTQNLFGLRTGMDFGPFFGVRGYYWRGVNDDFDRTQGVQSWGAESQFNLNAGGGAVPFLIAGVGRLEFRNDFRDPDGNRRDDETALILGGGLGLNLAERLRLDVAARDYVISNRDIENVSTTDDVSSNWMVTAGLTISLFGNPPDRQTILGERERYGERTEPRLIVRERGMTDGEEFDEEMADSLGDADRSMERRFEMRRQGPRRMMGPPYAMRERRGARRFETMLREVPPVRNYQGDRVVTLPVPEEGEIYIRYGAPGGVNIESRTPGAMHQPGSMHEMMTKPPMYGMPPQMMTPQAPATPAMPPAPAAPQTPPAPPEAYRGQQPETSPAPGSTAPATPASPGLSSEALAQQRFDDRMDRLEKMLNDRIDRMDQKLEDDRAAHREEVQRQNEIPETAPPREAGTNEPVSGPGWNPQSVRVYTGLNMDKPTQMVFGARLNLGPVTRRSPLNFLPELALGFGEGGTSFLVAGNVYYDFGAINENRTWNPFVGAGLGLLKFADSPDNHGRSGTEAVLNVAYGLNATVGRYTAFAEHQGIDLFDLNRILIGLRLNIR